MRPFVFLIGLACAFAHPHHDFKNPDLNLYNEGMFEGDIAGPDPKVRK